MKNEDSTEKRNEVPSSEVYNCVLTGFAKKNERVFGRDATQHLILSIGVAPEGVENAETYYADVPLIYTPGLDWEFYDPAKRGMVTRKTVSNDTLNALEYARKCFPDWAEYCDSLPEDDFKSAIAWFGSETSRGARARAKLVNETYTGRDGNSKRAHRATCYEVKQLSVVNDDFDAQFGKALKASGVKIGKAKSIAAKPKAPAAPDVPAAKGATREEVWDFYSVTLVRTDPNGAKFYPRCAEIIGKPVETWDTWTAAEWGKCLAEFEKMERNA